MSSKQQQQQRDPGAAAVDGDSDDELDVNADLELERRDDGSFKLGKLYIPPPPPPALTFESDKPRLIITHIENENFKSYAGKQTLGPFHKSFTSIVGPNGSGKSNVIDSMLFVFGYRAQKIRSKKISVLIHNSENHPDLAFATVTVHFQEIVDQGDKEDEFQVVEGSQFSVSRTVQKDNSAHYRINQRKVMFKEVQELLKAKGIDLDHNRFLILQGEVEQIAMMKAKGQTPNDTGMLEFLEDIIGSSRFQMPIDRLKESVAKLEEIRGEKLNRVKLVEKEKDQLEGPRNAALDYIRHENRIVEKKNLIYQLYVLDTELKIANTEEKKKEYEESASETINKAKQVAEERQEGEKKQSDAGHHLDKVRAKLEKAQEEFKEQELKDSATAEEMKRLNVKRKKLMQLAKEEGEKYAEKLRIPETNQEKIEECAARRDKLEAQREEEQAKYDQAIATLNEETKQYQDEKEEHENNLAGLKDALNGVQSVLQEIQMEKNLLRSNEEKERCKLEQFVATRDGAARELDSKKERYADLQAKIPATEKEYKKRQDHHAKLAQAEKELSDRLHAAEKEYREKGAVNASNHSKNQVLSRILAAKADGRLPGVFGRLGDLGGIDAKYDVAISTAAGSRLDNILVDNVETATKCIKFLREGGIGRATFLALDKQTNSFGRKQQGDFRSPENAPRLFDLIHVTDAKFLPAFYSALRDTLVARDIDQAQRIAFGTGTRHRVVTVKGELIEVSGAMAVGGRPARGKMGTQVVQATEDVNATQLKENVEQLKEEYKAVAREKLDLERAIVNAKKEIAAYKEEFTKLKYDLEGLKEKIQVTGEKIKSQEKVLKNTKPDQAKLDELNTKEEKQQIKVDAAQEKVAEVEADVARLNKKIKEIKANKLKGISRKLDEVTKNLESIKKEITRLKVEIKSADREVKKIKDRKEAHEKEVKEAEEKMRELQAERSQLSEVGAELINKLRELKQNEESTIKRCEELAEEVRKLKEAEEKLKSEQIEINQVREQYDSKIKDLSKNVSHWKRELKKLRLKEVPGDDTNLELPLHSKEDLDGSDMKKLDLELVQLEEQLATQSANFSAIEEYNKKEAIYLERVNELTAITTRKDTQKKYFEELRKQRLNEFLTGFGIITSKLKEMYQMITLGGDAELELVDTLDPFSEGITFSVRPPKKSWKNISNLSGGEKTLSSLALVFALHYYKPTPLYVMDEIDAALDFKNVSIVANYIKERTKNAQFIIISLRSNMFELADRLVGIYKTYNCTKSVTINPEAISLGVVEQ